MARQAFPWLAYALLLALAPLLLPGSMALALLSQIGIAIIACLALNMLLGQGGMLSFGHAVYAGLGAYAAVHLLRALGGGSIALPVSLVPLAGGLAGMAAAALLGLLCVRRAGMPFAMITLGLGELVWAAAQMFPQWFGGEAGVAADRVVGAPVLGISYGPAWQVYALIAIYAFACTAAMYFYTRTPAGRMLNAVRDNPARAASLGCSPAALRYQAFVFSGFFMGVSGGLGVLHFEIVTTEVLGTTRSGMLLLFTVLGGTAAFAGPILGAVLMVLCSVLLSELTRAWLLYMGAVFVFMLLLAPGGLASLGPALRARLQQVPLRYWGGLLPALAGLAGAAALVLGSAVVLVEMGYHRQLSSALGPVRVLAGWPLDTSQATPWVVGLALLAAGLVLLRWAHRRLCSRWQAACAAAAGKGAPR